ncbi:MAG: DsbA family oxidoreductase [Thermomicrobiales bacterium]
MQIELYSDIACPWCYIAERRLRRALAQRPDLQVEFHWRPFQLDPDLQPQGQPWRAFAEQKFGGHERVAASFARLNEAAAQEGITFSADAIATAANTRDAHRLVLLAQEEGKAWELTDALMTAYFVAGRDLNDHAQLVELAASVGLDAELARSVLASDWYLEDVAGSQQLAAEYGIEGVPFTIFAGRYALPGAQPLDIVLEAIDAAPAAVAAAQE